MWDEGVSVCVTGDVGVKAVCILGEGDGLFILRDGKLYWLFADETI